MRKQKLALTPQVITYFNEMGPSTGEQIFTNVLIWISSLAIAVMLFSVPMDAFELTYSILLWSGSALLVASVLFLMASPATSNSQAIERWAAAYWCRRRAYGQVADVLVAAFFLTSLYLNHFYLPFLAWFAAIFFIALIRSEQKDIARHHAKEHNLLD